MTDNDTADPPRVRVRRHPQLPPPLEVEPGPDVAEIRGLHDRFTISGKGRIDHVNAEDAMRRFRARQAAWRAGGPRPLLRIEQRSPSPHLLKLTIDDGSLVSGELTVEKRAGRARRWHGIASTLNFNASRFFRYHGAEFLRPGAANGAALLWRGGRVSGAARSYDGNDNWLEHDLLPRAVVDWERGLTRYFQDAVLAIENELREYFGPAGEQVAVQLFEQDRAVITQAEVYWEFRADDAIAAARYYGQAVHSQTSNDARKTLDFERNSARFRVRLGETLAVSIYAKTPDRVRFEVQYEGRIARLVRYNGEENVVRRLLLIRRDACRRLTDVVRPIVRDTSASSVARAAMTDFLFKVSAACAGSQADFSALLNLLISARRIVLPVPGVPDGVIAALVRKRVIRAYPRSRTEPHDHYVLAPLYQWVLERLDQAFPAYPAGRWTGSFRATETR